MDNFSGTILRSNLELTELTLQSKNRVKIGEEEEEDLYFVSDFSIVLKNLNTNV